MSLRLCAIIGPEAFRSGDSETAPDVSISRKDNEGERMAITRRMFEGCASALLPVPEVKT